MTTPLSEPREPQELRWQLIRDLSVFVAKVGLEALRDILLIPVALAAGLAGLLFSPSRPDRYFAEVLRLGDRFDGFVDLFGSDQAERRGGVTPEADPAELRADALFGRVEKILRDQHAREGVTAQAKETIDRALDAVHAALPRAKADPQGGPQASPQANRGESPYTLAADHRTVGEPSGDADER